MLASCLRSLLFVPALAVAATASVQPVDQLPTSSLNISSATQSASNVDVELRSRGIELYRQNKFVEASRVLQQAVTKNKADDEAWYYLGLALLNEGSKDKDAVRAFETATTLRPQSAAAHTGLAQALLLRNKLSDANHAAQTALRIDPSIAYAHYIIGVVLMNSGKPDEAIAKAKEVNNLNPGFAPAYLLKGQALVSVYARKTTAIRVKTPPPPPTPEQRAERHQKHLQSAALLKEASESVETYLRLNPGDPASELLREQLVTLNFYASYTGDKSSGDEFPVSSEDVSKKARILTKLEPAYTEEARRAQVSGMVVLRAVLSADGTVRHILVLRGLPHGLTEAVVKVARKLKFIPATVDGRPVSTFIQLEYNFKVF